MTINPEEIVDRNLLNNDKGRKIQSDIGDSSWGQLITPSKLENQTKTGEGMRVVLFGSYLLGYLLFETLKEFEKQNPNRLNIVGLVTDDPVSPTAKISVKRRIWRMFDQKEIIGLETAIIESGLKSGIPVFTGAVKTEYFRKLLKKWNPDVILVSVFGQIIDEPIISYPKSGIYNFHPADLLAGYGAGPQPYQDLIDRNAKTSKLTVHQLTVQLDAGPILGQSPPVNVRFSDGSITDNILVIDDKMIQVGDVIAALLIKTLILHKERGMKGPINKLDFGKHFNEKVRDWLMKPIYSNKHSEKLPIPSAYVDYQI